MLCGLFTYEDDAIRDFARVFSGLGGWSLARGPSYFRRFLIGHALLPLASRLIPPPSGRATPLVFVFVFFLL